MPNDLACVVFTRDNRNAQEFTSDRTRLLKAIDSFEFGGRTIGLPPNSPARIPAGRIERVLPVDRDAQPCRRGARRRSGTTQGGRVRHRRAAGRSRNGGRSGARRRDRATIFSGAARSEPMLRRIFDYMRDTYRRAQAANVNIYTVSPAGVGGMDHYIQSQRWQGRFVPPTKQASTTPSFSPGLRRTPAAGHSRIAMSSILR